MSYRFIKLSCDITTSTIWAEDDATLRLWIWMMASADRFGMVSGTIPGIAIAARVDVSVCKRAIERFTSPDEYSKNPANDGRRLEKVDGGWRLLNYGHYRDQKGGDPEWQAERNRKNVAAYRDRKRQPKPPNVIEDVSANPITSNAKPLTVSTEAEAEAELNTKPPTVVVVPTFARQEPSGDDSPQIPEVKAKVDPLEAIYQAYPRKVGKRKAIEAIGRAVLRLMNDERKTLEKHSRIMAARWLFKTVSDYGKSPAGNRGNLTPHPTTWFNQSRYLDDPNEWQHQEETRGLTKRQLTEQNLATSRELIRELGQARGDSASPQPALGLLPAASGAQPGGAVEVHRAPGRTEPRAVGDSVQPGGSGNRILPGSGSAPQTGRMPDRRPTF